jgi:DNA polymerase sigma
MEYPALRPLYLGTRTLLEARGLYGGAIEKDALLMLLVAFLKMNHGRFTGPNALGYQLIAFLKLYGTGVDLRRVGVAVDPPSFFDNETLRATDDKNAEPAYRRGQRSLMNAKRTAVAKGDLSAGQRLCIQDPTHFMKDLGRSSTRTTEVQSAFETAYEQLSEACEKWEGPGQDRSILATALRANFDDYEGRRWQINNGQRRQVNNV